MVPQSRYEVVIAPAAEPQIRKLPRQVQPDLIAGARELADDPRGHRVKKLVGRPEWRVSHNLGGRALPVGVAHPESLEGYGWVRWR